MKETVARKKPDLKAVEDKLPDDVVEAVVKIMQEKADEVFAETFERVLSKDVHQQIAKKLQKEWEKLAVEDVVRATTEILGQDYYEILRLSRWMRHVDVDMITVSNIDQALMALAGYFTPVNVTCGVLGAQLDEQYGNVVMDMTENQGYAVNRSQYIAQVKCSQIIRHKFVMERLRDAMIEQINILKRIRDGLWTERTQVTPHQPESSRGVDVMNKSRPWMDL